ncbi:phenylalanine--tRNA ligase beta subunit-related protein [Sphaerisporangium sp. TRM90804]|uniref:B3/B4 domain-containing protein n=1 Tax=Sphaerisporangium sp. TRM90804 TaxID=3031113 RepID=UPI002446C500|nr:phenylalanine--tRNA ligase beta subunit-related protein [Sphaerisporangium sp. TRM90804]MDH2427752.1 phenylalanine--tRNA ligase beta subunit-related protein [Sphaerisporangium sp. TRM90804]
MIEAIWIDEAVAALRPDFRVLAVAAYGLRNGPSDAASRELLAEAGAAGVTPAHEHIVAWQDAYRAFGAKPQRTRPSVDALVRRTPPPEVNLIVDAYNSVSVRHALPVGGEDLTRYEGPARLIRATGDEPFDTTDKGEPVVDHPEIGEVVWRDDRGVTCRRWNWRQCVRTRITEDTVDALFLLERLAPMPLEALSAAGEELAGLLRTISPLVRIESRLVSPA